MINVLDFVQLNCNDNTVFDIVELGEPRTRYTVENMEKYMHKEVMAFEICEVPHFGFVTILTVA